MDQVALVEKQLADGQKLGEQLTQHGFPVSALFWMKGIDDSKWYLYVASPVVDKRGILKAYERILATLRQMPQPFWIDSFEIKAVGLKDPIVKDVLDVLHRHEGKGPVRFAGHRLGDVTIDGAYLYPAAAAVA